MHTSVSSLLRRAAASGALVAVVMSALVVSQSPAAPASAAGTTATSSPTSDEGTFVTLANRARADAGLPALQNDGPLADTSRSWSAEMSARGQLAHDPDLAADASRVEPSWRTVGENVGAGYEVQQLHDAMMASSAHRANILSTRF